MPNNSEQGQRPVSSHAFSTWRWGLHSRAQEEGTLSFESFIFHLHDEESEHEHKHTSTSEDDLLKLLSLPEDTQKTGLASTRERKPIAPRHPRDHCGRMLLHESRSMTKTGHIMSLEYTKHMNEKDVVPELALCS